MTEALKTLSNTMAHLVEAAGPSVARIEARRRLPATGVVWSTDGLIVTANHIVERDENISIGLVDGTTHAAILIGRDPSTDLALLRVQATGLTPANWTNIDSVRVGHLVLALGRPGKTVQATLGIVSALGDAWRTHGGGQIDRYLQTDVAMYPGFSGGPLLTADGTFAGINTSAVVRGVSISVPTATVQSVVDTLLAHGRMPRGYLGIGIQPVRLSEDIQREIDQETGLIIMSVDSKSPASKAGILQGDILISLNGDSLHQIDDLQTHLGSTQIGQIVQVKFIRSNQINEASLTVGQRES